ncbi:MAG TPA: carboxypeptidase regulatory-like domain-containing protein [Sedimentisphaerales bacterium]|nr:carboxypeptidase regulatory-like domain-containing protein [Sedimentisphaerales bacterium]
MSGNIISVWGFVLLFSVTAWADVPEPLNITGRVVDFKAQPVEGAEIAVYENFYDYSTSQKSPKVLARTETGAQGKFEAQALVTYQDKAFIVARKPGLAMGWDRVNVAHRKGALGKYQIVLEPPCRISGVVRDENGSPVINARVRVDCMSDYLNRLEQRRISTPEEWFTAQTDARGKFQFENLSADVRAYFLIEASGWASKHKTSFTHGGMGYEAGRGDIQLILPSEVSVQGRVVDAETERAIEGVTLVMDWYRDQPWDYIHQPVVSDEDGRFRFDGVPVEKHFLRATTPFQQGSPWADKILVVETDAKKSNEFLVKLDKGGVIEVLVNESRNKKPVEGIKIIVLQREKPGYAGFYKTVQTGPDGKTQILAPLGKCEVRPRVNKGYVNRRQSKEVEIVAGKTERITFSLERKPQLTGLVQDESGKPVAGAIVKFYPSGGSTFADASGRFTVEYEPDDGDKCLIVRDEQRNLAGAVKVEDESRPIQVTLGPGLIVKGRVTDTNSRAIPAARISLCVAISHYLCPLGPEILTDAQGQYEFAAIPLAEDIFHYRYSLDASGYGPFHYKRVPIAAKPGETCELDTMILDQTDQSISGIVVDGEGKPVPNVPMFLQGDSQPKRSSTTGEDGTFVFRRICKGPLRIQANYPSFPGGAGYLKANGGDKNVKIILGQERAHVEGKTLIDHEIPSLSDLGVNLNKEQTESKQLLLCFFDMNQRPSRHLLKQLLQQTEQLSQKGLQIIAIKAEQVDKKTLDNWVTKNNITFPVGMITGDADKVKSNWAVNSLPWLILTDKEHVVQAEGFGINELDEKITPRSLFLWGIDEIF